MKMMRTERIKTALHYALVLLIPAAIPAAGKSIHGTVTGASGKVMEGVMVSAFDADHRKSISVFSQADGSFAIDALREVDHRVRVRLMGQLDQWIEAVKPGGPALAIPMRPASGEALEEQRPANSGFSMLRFDDPRDRMNFKMMCSYCHQIGTIPFRTPEKPIDWETMITRMDGYGGLYPHTKRTIVQRLIDTYKDDAVKKWPPFVPPPAPSGMATQVKITSWELGKPFEGSFHDLELGPDGLVYAVNISKGRTVTLDPETGEQKAYPLPRGSYAPHSIELGNDGHMWYTLCASGQMAKFDLATKKYTVCSSAEAPAKRGSYPHTLRINPKDPEGLVWYTDAGRNSCFSLHPVSLEVKEYPLLGKDQAVASGKGESRGITPYGLDFSPVDGMIWYSKLNGNRIGRIDPGAPDGDIKEWNPPFRGPRRLHVAPDGMVWVPGFGSGVFARFDPKREEWTVYELPDAANQIPYALNVDPKGFVWICGTGNDTLNRFDPRTEELVEFRLPMRVSYTREIEFDAAGNVWTSTSGPARHMERACGEVIKLELTGDRPGGGIQLVGRKVEAAHSHNREIAYEPKPSPNRALFDRIEATKEPEGYRPERGRNPQETSRIHQAYVDQRMAGLSTPQRYRVGELWKEKVKLDPGMANRGRSFVKILEYVARQKALSPGTREPKGKPGARRSPGEKPGKQLLSGRVRFAGPPPKRPLIQMNAESRADYPEPIRDERVLVGAEGGLANVFVYVKKGLESKAYPVPTDAALVNQERSMFRPRVQGLQVGQALHMRNSDPFIHNVRSLSRKNRPFNIAQPPGSEDREKVLTKKEGPITIKCDFHPWMIAHFFVMDHPFYAVSDAAGHFAIDGLAPGSYTLAAWHEAYGEQALEVRVGTGASRAAFTFKP